MGTFYVVATPIGNMKDITLRAIETLKGVDLVLAEDTRVTKKLLSRYDIQKPVWRADARAEWDMGEKVTHELISGKNIAFVSDAGTPNISDPGSVIVQYVREHLPSVVIVPIPGVSAITTLISVSGVSGDAFAFFGYPPHKKGRNTFFRKIPEMETPVVFYESPHRIEKTIQSIGDYCGENRKICIGRELTKIHEEVFWGTIREAGRHFKGERKRGEFVIIIPQN
jgi:16S rRNA (cytidine1402-2'-O)-methyltransferase